MTTNTEGEDIKTGGDATTAADNAEYEAAFGEFADPGAASDDGDNGAGDEDDAALAGAASDDLGNDDNTDPDPETDPGNSGDDDGNGGDGNNGPDPSGEDGSDIWAKAPPELRSAFEAERNRAEQIKKSQTGRVSALQRQINDLQAQIKAASRKGNAATDKDKAASGDAASKDNPLGDDDGFKALREEYPEIAQPIESMFNRMREDISRRDQTIENLMNKDRQVHIDEQEAALGEAHPDWESVIQSEEFGNWALSAPAHIRPILEQNADFIVDAAAAADAIELFKLRSGYKPSQTPDPDPTPNPAPGSRQTSGKRSRQLESGASAKSGRGGGGTGGPAKDNYDAAFDHYASKM